jgi:hypothetical protein
MVPAMNVTHPIVLGHVLFPGRQFTAVNKITGRFHRYTYRSNGGVSPSGVAWVHAVDHRGLCRSIRLDAITVVHKVKEVAA